MYVLKISQNIVSECYCWIWIFFLLSKKISLICNSWIWLFAINTLIRLLSSFNNMLGIWKLVCLMLKLLSNVSGIQPLFFMHIRVFPLLMLQGKRLGQSCRMLLNRVLSLQFWCVDIRCLLLFLFFCL